MIILLSQIIIKIHQNAAVSMTKTNLQHIMRVAGHPSCRPMRIGITKFSRSKRRCAAIRWIIACMSQSTVAKFAAPTITEAIV